MQAELESRNGQAVAKYFKGGVVAPDAFGERTWFQTTIAQYWNSQTTFDKFQAATEALLEAYKEAQGAWLSPVVCVFLARLRQLAADAEHLQVVKTLLDSVYRFLTITARQQKDDRINALQYDSPLCLFIVVQQMKIFQSLRQDTMIRSLVSRVVEQPNFPPLEQATLASRVAYSYFVGRNLVLEDNAGEAIAPLEFAWRHSPVNSKQRSRVLAYLLPAHLALGRSPRGRFVAIQGDFIAKLAKHIANGNVQAFRKEMESNQAKLCRDGTYPMLFRCQMFCCRNLVKLAVSLYRETAAPQEVNKFPLAFLFPLTARFAGEDEEETLCTVSNLIYIGLIKGYISFERKVLVVSATDAFPKTTLFKNWS